MECTACHRLIDANARLCAFCSADPRTGKKFDPSQLIEQNVRRKGDLPARERFLEFFRERQSIILTVLIAILFLLLVGLHRIVTARAATVSDAPAIPLSEAADIRPRGDQQRPLPLPDFEFSYEGSPRTMRTYLVEPGAVAPQPPATAPARP
jgi:hypothetical protein